jgi:hypothetical protein
MPELRWYILLISCISFPAFGQFDPNEVLEAWKIAERVQFLTRWEPSYSALYIPPFLKFKDVRVTRVILDLLDSSPPLLQHYLIRKLGELREEQSVEKLIGFARKGTIWWVQSAAIEALGKIRHRSAVVVLLDALESSHTMVQKRAVRSLREITGAGQDVQGKDLAQSLEYWKEWGKTRRDEYATFLPLPDRLPYWNPVFGFEIVKPDSTWKIKAVVRSQESKEVVTSQESLSFTCQPPEANISIHVWAESTKCPSLDSLVSHVETKVRFQLKDFERISLKPMQRDKLTGYRLCYRGKDEQNTLHEYIQLIFFASPNVYHLLLRSSPEQRAQGVRYLQDLYAHFHVREGK